MLKDFNDDGLLLNPITLSRVSYGFPLIDSIVSSGLSKANKAVLIAWVPDIN